MVEIPRDPSGGGKEGGGGGGVPPSELQTELFSLCDGVEGMRVFLKRGC